MGSRRAWNSLLVNSDLAARSYAATLLSLLQHMACSRAQDLSVFYAELKQGNHGVRNVSALLCTSLRRGSLEQSPAVQKLCHAACQKAELRWFCCAHRGSQAWEKGKHRACF